MIIPIKCFECGKPTGHLWETYVKKVQEFRDRDDSGDMNEDLNKASNKDKASNEAKNTSDEAKSTLAHQNLTQLTPEGLALKEMGMTRDCCRIIFLSNADVSMIISSR